MLNCTNTRDQIISYTYTNLSHLSVFWFSKKPIITCTNILKILSLSNYNLKIYLY